MNVRTLSTWRKFEVEEVLKKSYRLYRSSTFDIRISLHSNNSNNTRNNYDFGRILIITPKAMGSAPERNQFRRRLKALFYEEKLYHYHYDWIIFAKKGASLLDYSTLKTIFLQANTTVQQRLAAPRR